MGDAHRARATVGHQAIRRAAQGAPGVSPKTLTDRLRHLEAHEVVSREAFAEIPPRVEYRLTERGRRLEPILLALWEWGHDDLLAEMADDDVPRPIVG